MFLYEITHRYLKNKYQFFDNLKIKHGKIRGNCNLLIKVKFHKSEWSSPLKDKNNRKDKGGPQKIRIRNNFSVTAWSVQ